MPTLMVITNDQLLVVSMHALDWYLFLLFLVTFGDSDDSVKYLSKPSV